MTAVDIAAPAGVIALLLVCWIVPLQLERRSVQSFLRARGALLRPLAWLVGVAMMVIPVAFAPTIRDGWATLAAVMAILLAPLLIAFVTLGVRDARVAAGDQAAPAGVPRWVRIASATLVGMMLLSLPFNLRDGGPWAALRGVALAAPFAWLAAHGAWRSTGKARRGAADQR
jgi:hypothetical protein